MRVGSGSFGTIGGMCLIPMLSHFHTERFGIKQTLYRKGLAGPWSSFTRCIFHSERWRLVAVGDATVERRHHNKPESLANYSNRVLYTSPSVYFV